MNYPTQKSKSLRSEIEEITQLLIGHPRMTPIAIIDSSKLIEDVLYKVRKGHKSLLLRCLEDGIIRGLSPDLTDREVRKRLPHLSEKYKLPLADLVRCWEQDFRKQLTLVAIDSNWSPKSAHIKTLRDINDLDFLLLAHLCSAEWMITRDNDLVVLGIAEQNPENTLRLINMHNKMYDKAAGLTLAAGIGTDRAIKAGSSVISGIGNLWKTLGSLPEGLQLLIAGGAFYLGTSYFKSRQHSPTNSQDWVQLLSDAGQMVVSETTKAIKDGQNKIENMKNQLAEVPQFSQKPQTLKEHIGYIFARSEQLLTCNELMDMVLDLGYKTKNRQFENYLISVLYKYPEFARDNNYRWGFGTRIS